MGFMAAMFEVDFSWLLYAVIHARAFKATTTYPFQFIIYALCRSAGIAMWHVNLIKTPRHKGYWAYLGYGK